MDYSVNKEEVEYILEKQLTNWWASTYQFELIKSEIPIVLNKMFTNLSALSLTRCNNGKEIIFSPYDTVSWSVFLYYLSNNLFKRNFIREATLVYYLNKIMHCVEWFYELELPVHFFAEHPHNSILGKAKYGDYFFCFHGTTVGANYREDGTPVYPILGNNVFMCANSTILGNSHIGNNVIVAANTYIKDTDVPDNSIVFGQEGGAIHIKQMSELQIKNRTSTFWKWN